eukprot:2841245-Pyramimonas_sp.AAC.1
MRARRLSANAMELQAGLKIMTYLAMTPTGEVDLRSDSGYSRMAGDADDEVEGHFAGQTCCGVDTRVPGSSSPVLLPRAA